MSWAVGYDPNWKRDIGYGVVAFCDYPGCGAVIDRGLSYVCGGEVRRENGGCGLYFCRRHVVGAHQLCFRDRETMKTIVMFIADTPDYATRAAQTASEIGAGGFECICGRCYLPLAYHLHGSINAEECEIAGRLARLDPPATRIRGKHGDFFLRCCDYPPRSREDPETVYVEGYKDPVDYL
jgi:hypothetical protein